MSHTAQKLSFVFITNFFLFWSWNVLISCFLSRIALNAAATYHRKHQHQPSYHSQYDNCAKYWAMWSLSAVTITVRHNIVHPVLVNWTILLDLLHVSLGRSQKINFWELLWSTLQAGSRCSTNRVKELKDKLQVKLQSTSIKRSMPLLQ